jgi:hypothetical protein
MKNLSLSILALLFFVVDSARAQNLTAIDPRLNNGFVMTAHQLTVADFKGACPKGGNTSDSKMLIAIQALPAKLGYDFKVIPYFSYKSWIVDSLKADPVTLKKILKHEQNHYDINLLGAAELKRLLITGHIGRNDVAKRVTETRDKILQLEYQVNLRYETDTNYGRDEEQQQKWNNLLEKARQSKDFTTLVKYCQNKS